MKLNVLERLTLLQMLPAVKTNIVTWGMIDTVLDKVSLNEKEFKEFGIKQDGTQTTWNLKGSEEREIEIGEVVSGIIREELQKLNDAKPPQIEQRHRSLYKKFVGIEEQKSNK